MKAGGARATSVRILASTRTGGRDGPAVRRSAFAVTDQGVVSLGTFLTNVLLARGLAPAEYGAYVLVLGVVFFLNSVHAAVVTYPLSVRGATADRARLARLTGGAAGLAAALALPLGAALVAAVLIVGRPRLVPWALAALGLWHLQETVRRGLMAHLRHRDALWGDAVGYLGQAALVLALIRADRLSLDAVFAVMAATSAAAAALQAAQLGLARLPLSEGRRLAADFWGLGRWRLVASVLGLATTQAFPWALALSGGFAAAASLQAVVNVLGVSHPLMFGIGGLVVPATARAREERGIQGAWRTAAGYGAQGAAVLLPYYAALLLWPGLALGLFYGGASPYASLETPLRLYVLGYVLAYAALVLQALLNGVGDSRSGFFCQLAGAAAALALGLPLAVALGVPGAAVGGLLVSAAAVAAGLVLVRRAVRRGAPASPREGAALRAASRGVR